MPQLALLRGGRRAFAPSVIAALVVAAGATSVLAQSDQLEPSARAAFAHCAGCHGEDGRSADSRIPHLRGQNYDYLVYQLLRFGRLAPGSSTEGDSEPTTPIVRGARDLSARASGLMEQHAQGLTDGALRQIARVYSEMPCEAADRSRQSAPPRGLAWCDDCHGRAKVRDMTNVPILHGQWAEYLAAQLQAFKRATEEASAEGRAHHFMTRSTRSLSDRQIRDAAQHYARQPCVE